MKKARISLLLIFFFGGIASLLGEDLKWPMNFKGWGPSSEKLFELKSEKEVTPGGDTYYASIAGKASINAIGQKKESMIRTTCTEAARLTGMSHFMETLMGDALKKAKTRKKEGTVSVLDKGKVKLTCNFVTENPGQIVTRCQGMLSAETRQCLTELDSSLETYGTCLCLVGVKFPGGERRFSKSLRIK